VDVWIHVFLTPVLVGENLSASRLRRFTSGKRAPGAHWIGGGRWVPEPVWALWSREKNLLALLRIEPRPCSP
jgi:hypothetical protein